jgi:hypothetical protein
MNVMLTAICVLLLPLALLCLGTHTPLVCAHVCMCVLHDATKAIHMCTCQITVCSLTSVVLPQ